MQFGTATMNRIALLALPVATLATATVAQDEPAPAPAPVQYSEIWESWTPTWGTADIQAVAEMFIGTWETTGPVGEAGGDADGSTDMLMSVAAAPVAGVANALYVEQYRADSPGAPFRQSVMQIYAYKDGHRLRTYEIISDETAKGILIGMGRVPEAFPELSRESLIATLDLDISAATNGFKGLTPYPYPTGTGGAVEMTSSITVAGDKLITADRGYDANGTVVWGAGESASYTWTRGDDWAAVERLPGGLAIVTLAAPQDDEPVDGGRIFVHYTGWTADGNKFDSSIDKGQPWPLVWPIENNRVIDGWKKSFTGVRKGTVRKVVIPPSLAYGERGVPRANIGADATLYFNTEIMAVQAPAPVPETDAATEGGQD